MTWFCCDACGFKNQTCTGHEGNEEKHEVDEEGRRRGSASYESNEGDENYENNEGNESNESHEGNEGHEMIALQGDFNAGSAWVI